MSDLPEADRAGSAPHPRETLVLYGQDAAEQVLLEAWAEGRLHHAWLLSAPRGVGKATLAWRLARALRAHGLESAAPKSLGLSADHPVSRRTSALSEPGIHLVRRGWDAERKRLRTQILVDDIRALQGFFSMSSADGGRRLAIIDAACEMNIAAQNALLKLLEEPPRGAHLVLVCHAPSRLLPTIRSRCRHLRLKQLEAVALAQALDAAGVAVDDSAALAELAGGSAGQAVRLSEMEGLELYARIAAILTRLPMDREAIAGFVGPLAARGAEARLTLAVELFETALARAAASGAGHPPRGDAAPDECANFAAVVPTPAAARDLAAVAAEVSGRLAHGLAVNVDAGLLLTDAFLKVEAALMRHRG